MRAIAFFSGLLLALSGCTENTALPEDVDSGANQILLLQIDFTTQEFEGGLVQNVSAPNNSSDSIPVKVVYQPPGDFGNLAMYYKPSDKLLFDGGVFWMGKGTLKFPNNLNSASEFAEQEATVPLPDPSRFQILHYEPQQPINYELVWSSVKKLKVTSEYLAAGKKVGLFLYTPSVGLGDPKDWDWYIMLYK
ncbi:hypothetical protein [Pedobacter sp. SYSU D00535]|uniref:hypothetical protein n=1 Tax=Pedobacter sp. SYSU D00535 TaxID=2810308 RepID=UPI001A96424C|nr:hypothetical protein [Pedobacter sp. SYSU D00535]